MSRSRVVAFLRLRAVFFLLVLIVLSAMFYLHYHYLTSRWIVKQVAGYHIMDIWKKYEILNVISENLAVIIDGKFILISKSLLSALFFVLSIFLFRAFANYIVNRAIYRKLIYFIFFLILTSCFFIYSFLIKHLSFSLAVGFTFAILFVYLFDFTPVRNKRALGIFFILTPIAAEILCMPLYLELISEGTAFTKGMRALLRTLRYAHFTIFVLLGFCLVTPLNNVRINGALNLKEGSFYGLAVSEKTSKLFIYNQLENTIQAMKLDGNKNDTETVFPATHLSETIEVNDERGELYFIERSARSLVIMDIKDYQENPVYLETVRTGDSRITFADTFLFTAQENPSYLYKVDLTIPEVAGKEHIEAYINCMSYNRARNVLYTNEWYVDISKRPPKYCIYEIDPKDLKILRRIPVPGGCWDVVVSRDGTRLYCSLPYRSPFRSYIYIFDTETFVLIDKIKAPLGVRALALDEERGLIFAGSAVTNLIELIDLKSRKTLKIYRAGRYSLRHIALDKKRRTFFVSTKDCGLFAGSY